MGKTKFTKTRPAKGESRSEYDEPKQRCNLTLTPTAITSLDRIATHYGISRSELVERLARVGDERIMKILEKETQMNQPIEPTEGQSVAVRQAHLHYVLGRSSYFEERQDTNYDPFPGMTDLEARDSEDKESPEVED